MTARPKLPFMLDSNRRLDRWVQIDSGGTVTVRTGKVEIGQGIVTAMAQMAADELDVSIARVRMVPVDTSQSPDEGSTSGSRSVEEGGGALRQACAEVRDAFLQAAARRLQASLESLSVDDGTISVRGRESIAAAGAVPASITYWQLVPDVDLAREATGQVRPKLASELRIVGQSLPRLDVPRKLSGAAYVQDMRLPGMLFGRVVRPPSYRAKLIVDGNAAGEPGASAEPVAAACTRIGAMPGVRAVVREGNFLGVVAEREEQAIAAARALAAAARWTEVADLPDMEAMTEWLLTQPAEIEPLSEKAPGSLPQAGRTLQAVYTRPYLSHGSIGPSCAVAWWHHGQLEVWSHSQAVFPLRDEIAKALAIDAATITVRHAEGAGAYGHNGADDAAFDAVLLARAVEGAPVKLQWMREDEHGWEAYGPAMAVRVRASLDAHGSIVDWQEDVHTNRHISRPGRHPNPGLLAAWHLERGFEPPPAIDMPMAQGGASQRNAVPLYDFPNQRVTLHAIAAQPLRASTLRALGAYANVFAIESMMDELAKLSGVDPVAFRLRHMHDPRARAVIEAVAKLAAWQSGETGDGSRGRGIGFARYKNAGNYVAVIAEVVVEEQVRVPRCWTALDCGRIVNPDGVINQAEGGIVQATSWTLKEQVRFDRTRILTRDWESYPILTFGEAPKVETVLLDRPEDTSLGVGEGMAGPVAAAIGNAVCNAMGVRVRDLPLTPERIMAAMDG
jgi:nicotinate dehydrogenase subunit B